MEELKRAMEYSKFGHLSKHIGEQLISRRSMHDLIGIWGYQTSILTIQDYINSVNSRKVSN
jgi:hypothetical protein